MKKAACGPLLFRLVISSNHDGLNAGQCGHAESLRVKRHVAIFLRHAGGFHAFEVEQLGVEQMRGHGVLQGLKATGVPNPDGDTAFDVSPLPAAGLPGVQLVNLG